MTHTDFVNAVITELSGGELTLQSIETVLRMKLHGVSLVEKCHDMIPADADDRANTLRRFIACKMVEGCTQRTLAYYSGVMKRFMLRMPKPIERITIDDIRYYIAIRGMRDQASKQTQDNELRILKSFFGWASANGIRADDPARGVKCIRVEKRVKKPFTPEEQELLRVACQGDARAAALLEVMLSTGCRVGEIAGMKRSDISDDEVVVFGKGQKERKVFLNARAKVALGLYLKQRDDDSEALFVSERKPYKALSIPALESIVRVLGVKAGVSDTHPHKFRRTAATTALRRGMPIEQVQSMLGHESIATTLVYAKIADDAVKQAHKRLM